MKGARLKLLSQIYIVFVGVAAACLLLTFSDRLSLPTHLNISALVALCACQIALWIYSGEIWKRALALYGNTALSLSEAMRHFAILTTGKYLPGTIWGVLARSTQATGSIKGNSAVWRATLYEQVASLHGAIVLGGTIMVGLNAANLVAFIASLSLIASVPGFGLIADRVEHRAAQLLSATPPSHAHGNFPENAKKYCVLVLLFLIQWLLAGLILIALASALNLSIASLSSAPLLIGVTALGGAAGFIAIFAPGGIGVREATAGALLTSHLETPAIIALMLWYRAWIIVSDLTLAALAWTILRDHGKE